MADPMSPAQTALDIIETVPAVVPCCSGDQAVPSSTIAALREAVRNAAEDERIMARILARALPVAQAHVGRMQAEADGAVALNGKPHPVSEELLLQARELLYSIRARVGVSDD